MWLELEGVEAEKEVEVEIEEREIDNGGREGVKAVDDADEEGAMAESIIVNVEIFAFSFVSHSFPVEFSFELEDG